MEVLAGVLGLDARPTQEAWALPFGQGQVRPRGVMAQDGWHECQRVFPCLRVSLCDLVSTGGSQVDVLYQHCARGCRFCVRLQQNPGRVCYYWVYGCFGQSWLSCAGKMRCFCCPKWPNCCEEYWNCCSEPNHCGCCPTIGNCDYRLMNWDCDYCSMSWNYGCYSMSWSYGCYLMSCCVRRHCVVL